MTESGSRWAGVFILLSAFLIALSSSAFAEDKVLDVSRLDQRKVELSEYFAVLEDPGRVLTLADVMRPEFARRFAIPQATMISYGYTRSAFWLRLPLSNASDKPVERMLEIGFPLISSIQFSRPMADGSYQTLVTGNATPFSTRPHPNRLFVFPLTLPAHSVQVVYLRLQSVGAMIVGANLWEPQAYHEHERLDYIAQATYFGMATAMILFNLLLFFALRDVVYLLYTGFAISKVFAIFATNGLAKEFFWPNTMLWSNIAVGISYSVMLVAWLLFMRRMLNTREIVPRTDWVIKGFIGILLLFPFGLAYSYQAFMLPATLFYFATGIMMLSVSFYCAGFKRQPMAMFFLLACGVFMTNILMAMLFVNNLVPSIIASMYQSQRSLITFALQIGSAMEMLLLAFALAYRFNMIRCQAIQDVKRINASIAERLVAREAELTESHEKLREIEHHQTLSDERQRLVQDMHDGLGSSLISALRVVENGKIGECDVAQVLKGCIDDLKLAIDSMEPVERDLLLLLATLRYRLAPRLDSAGISLHWEVQDVPALDWLDPKNSLHILRILQEAFANIIKHTQASEIHVATRIESNGVVVSITDNGKGFDMASALQNGGKGLSNQLRRAKSIGADIHWTSTDEGTCLSLWLPQFAR
jgi:signal transduction histidine kinase